MEKIHELILEDRRISAKSRAEQQGISHERVGSIIHEDLDVRILCAKWVPKSLMADQKRQRCQSSEQHLEFFGAIQMISCRDLWPWTKPSYITMSKSSWMMDPTRSCEMPSCWAIDLAKIRRSSKVSSWIWSIISGVITVLVRPGRGASQVERSPHLNWTTQFLTVAYYGACSPNISVRMVWIFFGALPCRKKNLMTARVSELLK